MYGIIKHRPCGSISIITFLKIGCNVVKVAFGFVRKKHIFEILWLSFYMEIY